MDPVPVESIRNPLGQVDCRHRITGEIRGIQDHQIAAVARRVVDVRQVPAVALVGRIRRRDEYRFSGPAPIEAAFDGAAVGQVVPHQAVAADGHPVEDVMRRVSTMLASEPSGLKKGDLTRQFKDMTHELENALQRLKKEGHIVIEPFGPAKLHKHVKPYPAPDDTSLPSS